MTNSEDDRQSIKSLVSPKRSKLSDEEKGALKDKLSAAAKEVADKHADEFEVVRKQFRTWREERQKLVDSIDDELLKESVSR